MKNHQRKIFGKETRRQDFGNFVLVESVYPARSRIPRHTHEIAHVSFVLQGSFTESCGRRQRASEPSALIIHPPDEDHSVAFDNAGARVFSFHIKPRLHERISDYTKILDVPAAIADGQTRAHAARLYLESKIADAVAPMMIESLALEIIALTSRRAETLRDERQIPFWLKQAQEYLHAHFTENIAFAILAETIGTHPVRLAREFRRAFQCTMGAYVRRLRVESACREISGSDTPIGEIALKFGFYDQSHFSNVFKRLTGATPAQYRAVFRHN